MKEYNDTKSPEEKIRIYGMDLKGARDSADILQNYLERVGSSKYEEIKKIIPEVSTSDLNTVMMGKVSEIAKEDLSSNKDLYISKSSEAEFDLMNKVVEQLEKTRTLFNSSSRVSGSAAEQIERMENIDLEMANNVEWIRNYEKKYFENDKIMISGHSGHIAESFSFKSLGSTR